MYSGALSNALVDPCARRPSAGEAVIGEDDVGLSGSAYNHAEQGLIKNTWVGSSAGHSENYSRMMRKVFAAVMVHV